MDKGYPNWDLFGHIGAWIGHTGTMIGSASSFWLGLGALFVGFWLGMALIPVSIVLFIFKNNGRVGVATWVALPATLVIGFIWMMVA